MNKKDLLKHLKEDIYCRIKPSPLGGVGVFAIRKIPKGTNPFKGSIKAADVRFKEEELVSLHPEVFKMVKDFGTVQDGYMNITAIGLNRMDISFFLNHSNKPNLSWNDYEEEFVAARNIKPGEELLTDYKTFSELSNI